MFCSKFPLPCGLFVLVFSAGLFAHPYVQAETPFQKQLAQVQASNQAMRSVARARLELQQHHLEILRGLHEDGHASWLELARQQLVVDQLTAQLDAFARYEQFISSIQEHQQNFGVSQVRHITSPQPMKLYEPNSLRLIGWIEPGSMDDASPVGPLPGESLALVEAREKLEQAKKKLEAVQQAESAPTHWLKQATLLVNLADAELGLARLREQSDARLVAAPNLRLPETGFLTAIQHEDLKQSAWRVSFAEANATGALRQAELELKRLQRRAYAIEKLFEQGFASEGERNAGQKKLQESQERVEDEKQRLQRSLKRCERLVDEENVADGHFEIRPGSDCDWPAFILEDAHRLDHVIELRRQYFDLLGQQAAASCKLEMWKTWTDKMRDAVTASNEINAVETHVAKLSRSLDEGQRVEVQKLELEMEAIRATIQELNENQNVLALEEQRFIDQCEQQDQMRRASMVSTAGAGSISTEELFPRFSYLESLKLRSRIDLLDDSCFGADYLSFSFLERPPGLPLLPASGRSSLYHDPYRLSDPSPYKWFRPKRYDMSYLKSGLLTRGYCYRAAVSRLNRHRYFRDSSYLNSYSYYQYGILRPEYRRCAPVGQRPWYIPGFPDNYRGW